MNEDEDDNYDLNSRPPESFTDFVLQANNFQGLQPRVSAPFTLHQQRSLENVSEIVSTTRQMKRRNSSGDSL